MKRTRLLVFLLLAACAHRPAPSMNEHAAAYVKLALALGEHDSDWVDAYYGPPEWREAVKSDKKILEAIHAEAATLLTDVERAPVSRDSMLALRRNYLIEQLGALLTKSEMLQGKKFSFDEEARRLYGVTPARHDDAFFDKALSDLDKELPGQGTLAERVEAFRSRFNIPPDRVDAVIRAALQECRARTLQHIDLPAGESFTLEYVKNQPWSGYNWYKGNYTSLIQVNTDLPIAISRALDLACHEGYPGHHTYNVLLEKNLVRDRGWVEYSVYPLNSPQSLIAEGSGNYGLVMAFPGDERMKFDRDVLFPLAGFDPADADRYHRVLRLTAALGYTSSEVARRYLDGEMTRDQAKAWLVRYGLSTPERAEQQIKFAERYRSYVINYTLGQDLVRQFIEKSPDRWTAFEELLSKPLLPSNLQR
ncbi:MAG: hypothetical protein ABI779_19550 [Acidobacteriota bacterium]